MHGVRWRWWAWLPAIVVAAALAAAAGVAVQVSRRVESTLHPSRQPVGLPDGLTPVVDVELRTRDSVLIRGWYRPSTNRAAVILVHGHGSQRGQLLPEARMLARRGYGVLLFDSRGHGESGGVRTTWGVEEPRDVRAALDYLVARADVDAERIGAFGFSMGAASVAMVAEHDSRLRGVVLEGASPTLEDGVRSDERRWGWWSGTVAAWTLRRAGIALDSVRPIDELCMIAPRPVLIIVGGSDTDTPERSGDRVYAAACEPKDLWVIPGATHRTYVERGGAEYERRLGAFFDSALLSQSR